MAYKQISDRRQWGKAILAALLAGVWFLLFLAFAFPKDLMLSMDPQANVEGRPDSIPLLMAIFLGLWLSQTFMVLRCLKSRSAHVMEPEDIAADPRAPVIYLRPFTQDNAVLSSGARVLNPLNPLSWGKLLRWRGILSSYAAFLSFQWTFEQLLAAKTRELGPLIAIGQPGAPPIMGANNLFVGDAWQDRVAELCGRAQLVVLAAGDTTGILWEVNFMLRSLDPGKCLIYVENGRYRWWWPLWRKGSKHKLWTTFRTLSQGAFPVPLPERIGRASFIAFDAGWAPRLLDPPRHPAKSLVRDRAAYQLTQLL